MFCLTIKLRQSGNFFLLQCHSISREVPFFEGNIFTNCFLPARLISGFYQVLRCKNRPPAPASKDTTAWHACIFDTGLGTSWSNGSRLQPFLKHFQSREKKTSSETQKETKHQKHPLFSKKALIPQIHLQCLFYYRLNKSALLISKLPHNPAPADACSGLGIDLVPNSTGQGSELVCIPVPWTSSAGQ